MEFENGSAVQLVTPKSSLIGVNFGQKYLLSNATKNFFVDDQPYRQIISDELMWSLNFYLNILLCGGMAIFGTLNNAVNMIIFYKLGLNDSMSVYLFALAFTDFLLSFVIVVTRIFPIWHLFFYDGKLDPMAILYVGLAWVADSLFLTSGWITTCLSLERCICVMFPFKVKRIFTKNRSIICVIVIHFITAATYMPIYLTQWLGWTQTEIVTNNGSVSGRRMVVMFSENRAKVEYYVEILNVTVIPVPALIIILGSVFWMVYGLTMSSVRRKSMMAGNSDKDGDKQDSNNMTFKTRRLVKVVVMLAIIFTICSIPRAYATYINIINPEINEGGKERNLSIFQWQFARFFSTMNASVNFFVYLKINSSYRGKFHELLFSPFHGKQ